MNKNGQTLIMFVILLPIIILFVIYIIVASNNYLERNHLSLMIKDNLKIILDKDIRDIDKMKEKFKEDDNNIQIDYSDNNVKITVRSLKKGLFDNIYKIPEIEVNICGNYETKEIKEC